MLAATASTHSPPHQQRAAEVLGVLVLLAGGCTTVAVLYSLQCTVLHSTPPVAVVPHTVAAALFLLGSAAVEN